MENEYPPWLMPLEEVQSKLMRKDFAERKQEYEQLRKDISTARSYIRDAIARYTKKRLRLRSRKAAEDPFAELADYRCVEDIQDAYGYELISDARRRYLTDLWEARKESLSTQGKFEDQVTKLLQNALNHMGEECHADLEEFEAIRDALEAERRRAVAGATGDMPARNPLDQ